MVVWEDGPAEWFFYDHKRKIYLNEFITTADVFKIPYHWERILHDL